MRAAVLGLVLSACIVNNNMSPGASGTVAPQTTIDPQVGAAAPGGSVQVNRAPAPPPSASTAPAPPSGPPYQPVKMVPAAPPP